MRKKMEGVFSMPAAAHKSAISYGPFYIPVALYNATESCDTGFHLYDNENHSPIRKKTYRESDGKEMVEANMVRGLEIDGELVTFTKDELENLKTKKEKSLLIDHFAPIDSIDPILVEKFFYVAPEGSDKAFELLRRVMESLQAAAIARTTALGTNDSMIALVPKDEGLLLQKLHFLSEVKAKPVHYTRPEISETELKLGEMLLTEGMRAYQPELYHNE